MRIILVLLTKLLAPPATSKAVKRDAVRILEIVEGVIPKGSTIYKGKAAGLRGKKGGGLQIFLKDPTAIKFKKPNRLD